MFARLTLICLAALLSWGFAPPAGAIENEICLIDNPGGLRDVSMRECTNMERYPGDGGAIYNGQFYASRQRVSDQWNYESSRGNPEKQIFDNGAYIDPEPVVGVRLNAGTSTVTPIDAHGICRYVYNNSTEDIFIPFRSRNEWVAFIQNATASYGGRVTLKTCALPCNGHCQDNGYFFGPTDFDEGAGDQDVSEVSIGKNWFPTQLPYAPTGSVWPKSDGVVNQHEFKYRCYSVHSRSTGECIHEGYRDPMSGQCREKSQVATTTPQTCCLEYGSECYNRWHDWTEIWKMNPLVAGASEDNMGPRANGWPQPTDPYAMLSSRVGGSGRPAACNEGRDLVQVGKRCLVPPPDPNQQQNNNNGNNNNTPKPPPTPRSKCTF